MSNYKSFNDIADVEERRISTGYTYIDHMLGGGLPLGAVSMFAGEAGTGKSRLSADISANVTKHMRTLYFQLEMTLPMFKRYVKDKKMNANNFAVSDSKCHNEIVKAIRDYRPGLVVIDSVNMIDESHNIHMVRKMMNKFIEVAQEISCHIILIGQIGKDKKVKGSTDWVYLPDIVCHLNRVKLDKKKVDQIFDVPARYQREAAIEKEKFLSKTAPEENKKRFLISIPEKNRFGPVGHAVTMKHFPNKVKQLTNEASFHEGFAGGSVYPTITLSDQEVSPARPAPSTQGNLKPKSSGFLNDFKEFCMSLGS